MWECRGVDIFRSPVAGEPAALVFVGRAVFIRGARPDVQVALSERRRQRQRRLGFHGADELPAEPGQRHVRSARATRIDWGGACQTLLGTRRIVAANASSVKPFGTIDTPGQGETVSGTIVNFGWALTPQPSIIPINGSTIDVYVDGVNRGHPVYNNNRSDIAGWFPGLRNSAAARSGTSCSIRRRSRTGCTRFNGW